MLQEIKSFPCCAHKTNLTIHELAIRPTEIAPTEDENALGDGAIFEVMAVHLDNRVFQILIRDDLHRPQSRTYRLSKKGAFHKKCGNVVNTMGSR